MRVRTFPSGFVAKTISSPRLIASSSQGLLYKSQKVSRSYNSSGTLRTLNPPFLAPKSVDFTLPISFTIFFMSLSKLPRMVVVLSGLALKITPEEGLYSTLVITFPLSPAPSDSPSLPRSGSIWFCRPRESSSPPPLCSPSSIKAFAFSKAACIAASFSGVGSASYRCSASAASLRAAKPFHSPGPLGLKPRDCLPNTPRYYRWVSGSHSSLYPARRQRRTRGRCAAFHTFGKLERIPAHPFQNRDTYPASKTEQDKAPGSQASPARPQSPAVRVFFGVRG